MFNQFFSYLFMVKHVIFVFKFYNLYNLILYLLM